MSKTTDVFGIPKPGYYRVYYVMQTSRDLEKALQSSHSCPVVLMFSADGNEPSKVMLDPFWDMAMAKKYRAVFCRVDAVKFKDAAKTYGVEALPTFVLIRNGIKERKVVAMKAEELNTIQNSI